MSETSLEAVLARAFPDGTAPAPEIARRQAALAAFERHGYPGRRLEAWRYTDLGRLAQARLEFPAPPQPGEAELAAVRATLAALPYGDDDAVAVFIDGRFAAQISRLPDTIRQQLESGARKLPTQEAYRAPEPRHALAALNEAFARPLSLELDADTVAGGGPLVMLFVACTPERAIQLRLELATAAGTNAQVVQHFADASGNAGGWINALLDLELATGSTLELIRIQELGAKQSMTTLLRPRLEAGARLVIGSIDTGGALIRTDIEAELVEPDACVDLFGLAAAGDGQHIDNHVCADHRAPATNSSQTFRSIVDAGGRAVFNGKVIVRPDAQGIDAHQRSDNLLLAKNAEVDTKPELEIYADDVRCSHGATIGELDENELFYLQSRGIPADAARRLLTFGFANRIVAEIPGAALRRHVGGRVSGLLGDSLPTADDLLLVGKEPAA